MSFSFSRFFLLLSHSCVHVFASVSFSMFSVHMGYAIFHRSPPFLRSAAPYLFYAVVSSWACFAKLKQNERHYRSYYCIKSCHCFPPLPDQCRPSVRAFVKKYSGVYAIPRMRVNACSFYDLLEIAASLKSTRRPPGTHWLHMACRSACRIAEQANTEAAVAITAEDRAKD